MPIDPSIILNARAPQIQTQTVDPLQRAGQVLNLQGAMGTQQMEALKLKQAQQAMAEDEQAKEAFRGGGSESEILQRLMGISPKTGMAYGKQLQEGRKTEAEIGSKESETRKRQYDIQIDKWQRAASILSNAKDQDSYTAAVRMIALDVDPQLIAGAPQQFNPQFVQQAMAKGQTIVQRLADQRAQETAAETRRRNLATETETGRHNVATERTAAGQLGVAQGNLGVARGRLAMEQNAPKGQYDPERAVMIDPRTGQATPVTMGGAPLGPKEKDAPEALLKAAGYADRMQKAEQILATVPAEAAKPGVIETAVPRGKAGATAANISRSSERQRYNQAAEDWVRAKLRQESGAVIADEEMEREIRTYFPQIGDEPAVIAQKAAARRTAEQGMRTAAGRAAPKTAATPPIQETKTIGRKQYIKVNGQWFEQN